MSEKVTHCPKCGTLLVPIQNDALLNQTGHPIDGTITFDGRVCPKCHPEYAGKES